MNHRYDLLKHRRKELGLSLEAAAIAAGVGKGTVHESERPTGNPRAGTINALSGAYGIDPSFILNQKLKKKDFNLAVLNGRSSRQAGAGSSRP